MTSPRDSEPMRKSMLGWGRYLGDLDQPQTIEEAQLHATMATADRLVELVTIMSDVQMRLARIEIWIEHNDPTYANLTPSVPFKPAIAGAERLPHHERDAAEAI